jgi:predicted nucleic acid-binding protein
MRKKIKVVIDTGVFIDSWFSNKYFYCDTHIFDDKKERQEYLYNLSDIFLDAISVNTLETECPKLNDKFDEMFLKTAIKGEADFIISNDFRSGIHNTEISGIKIASAKDFVSLYEGLVK